jgi:hypothetical protein
MLIGTICLNTEAALFSQILACLICSLTIPIIYIQPFTLTKQGCLRDEKSILFILQWILSFFTHQWGIDRFKVIVIFFFLGGSNGQCAVKVKKSNLKSVFCLSPTWILCQLTYFPAATRGVSSSFDTKDDPWFEIRRIEIIGVMWLHQILACKH